MNTSHFPTRDQMRDTVDRYLASVATGTAEQIADLYASAATLEDPAGATPLTGRAAIADFYLPLTALERRTSLLDFRAAGDTAAFCFEVQVIMPGRTITTTPIDVMTFDADGGITSMRAIWSGDDVQTQEDLEEKQ